MELEQPAPDAYPILRPHATVVGLVQPDDGWPARGRASRPASTGSVADRSRRPSGRPAPLFVFPNHGDHDYALAALDDTSVAFALDRLPDLPDPMLRQQTWSALWDMVRDGHCASTAFLEAVERFAPGEQDPAMLTAVLDRADSRAAPLRPRGRSSTRRGRLFADRWTRCARCDDPGRADHLGARGDHVRRARAPTSSALTDLVDGDGRRRRFRARPGHALVRSLVKAAAARPPGRRGAGSRPSAAATHPTEASVRAPGRGLVAGRSRRRPRTGIASTATGYGSDYRTRAAMAGFHWRHQRDAPEPYRGAFFDQVRGRLPRPTTTRSRGAYARAARPRPLGRASRRGAVRDLVGRLDDSEGAAPPAAREVGDDLERDDPRARGGFGRRAEPAS